MDETEENEYEGSKILENVKGDISFKDVTFFPIMIQKLY